MTYGKMSNIIAPCFYHLMTLLKTSLRNGLLNLAMRFVLQLLIKSKLQAFLLTYVLPLGKSPPPLVPLHCFLNSDNGNLPQFPLKLQSKVLCIISHLPINYNSLTIYSRIIELKYVCNIIGL